MRLFLYAVIKSNFFMFFFFFFFFFCFCFFLFFFFKLCSLYYNTTVFIVGMQLKKEMHFFRSYSKLKRYYNRTLNRKRQPELSIFFATLIHRIEAIVALQIYKYRSVSVWFEILFTQIADVLLQKPFLLALKSDIFNIFVCKFRKLPFLRLK